MDTTMSDLIHKLHHGDGVKGWEGDPNLAVYWNQPEERWELWRLEDDGHYRRVCRSGEGIPFDERVIDALIKWDGRRRRQSLHDEVVANNERIDRQRRQDMDDWLRGGTSILARTSQGAALATAPRTSQCRYKHVELVHIQGTKARVARQLSGSGMSGADGEIGT